MLPTVFRIFIISVLTFTNLAFTKDEQKISKKQIDQLLRTVSQFAPGGRAASLESFITSNSRSLSPDQVETLIESVPEEYSRWKAKMTFSYIYKESKRLDTDEVLSLIEHFKPSELGRAQTLYYVAEKSLLDLSPQEVARYNNAIKETPFMENYIRSLGREYYRKREKDLKVTDIITLAQSLNLPKDNRLGNTLLLDHVYFHSGKLSFKDVTDITKAIVNITPSEKTQMLSHLVEKIPSPRIQGKAPLTSQDLKEVMIMWNQALDEKDRPQFVMLFLKRYGSRIAPEDLHSFLDKSLEGSNVNKELYLYEFTQQQRSRLAAAQFADLWSKTKDSKLRNTEFFRFVTFEHKRLNVSDVLLLAEKVGSEAGIVESFIGRQASSLKGKDMIKLVQSSSLSPSTGATILASFSRVYFARLSDKELIDIANTIPEIYEQELKEVTSLVMAKQGLLCQNTLSKI